MSDGALSNIEKLRIAGYVAPRVRQKMQRGTARKIQVVSKNGSVVRTISEADLAFLMCASLDIVFGTEGKREGTVAQCQSCGTPYIVPDKFTQDHFSDGCPKCRSQVLCVGAGSVPCPRKATANKHKLCRSKIEERNGRPWRCRYCANMAAGSLRRNPSPTCSWPGCGAIAPKKANSPAKVKERHGAPWACRKHAQLRKLT